MDKIYKIVEQLNEKNSQWEEYFTRANFLMKIRNDGYTDETKELINSLLNSIRNKQLEIADQNSSEESLWNKLKEMDISDETLDMIKKSNRSWIVRYKNLEPLRQMGDNVVQLLIDIFTNVSVNYNPQFLHKCEEYEITDDRKFINAVLQLDQMISMHIERHYNKKTAQAEFLAMSGLNEKYGLIYGELYEKNLLKIQNNICIDRMMELNQKVDKLSEQLNKLIEKEN